ncbi:hypothetical protein SAMN06295987_1028 [Novosphingobium mathurense]|uniref:Uncharacterized protein n=1 Tax=Novosphingobium mathurense TaxID=428990 RepID=A0A1U6HB87_9SPHN|nr:hypothetical protein SAMN06295987_1028 [Novosphingobium mathurense]
MSIADLIRSMAALGAPAEAIALAVEAIEAKDAEIAAREAVAEERRARDAKRKRDERAARRVQGQSADNPGTVQGESGTDPLSPSPSSSPQTPHQHPRPHTPANTEKPRAREATLLPADWEPEPLTGSAADAVASWRNGALERELDRFRDWAASTAGPNSRKKDWQAAWRNWVLKADDEGRNSDRRSGRSRTDRKSVREIGMGLASGHGTALDQAIALGFEHLDFIEGNVR